MQPISYPAQLLEGFSLEHGSIELVLSVYIEGSHTKRQPEQSGEKGKVILLTVHCDSH